MVSRRGRHIATCHGVALLMCIVAAGRAVSGPLAPSSMDAPVIASDPAAIHIQVLTNDHEANAPPGPMIRVGDGVTWTYIIKNMGFVPLADVAVTDDRGVSVECPGTTLDPGGVFICSATWVAQPGQYANVATVTATADDGLKYLQGADRSHYFGAIPEIELQTQVRGENADEPPGPIVLAGTLVEWSYSLTNTGNVTMGEIVVADDHAGPIECAAHELAPDESTACFAQDTATAGQMKTFGMVVGTGPDGLIASDFDTAYAFGADPSVTIEKHTNRLDADEIPGVFVHVASAVQWTYDVINTGNVELTGVSVFDEQVNDLSCSFTGLLPGTVETCFAAALAEPGQRGGIATVTGSAFGLAEVSDTDPSHYFGSVVSIDVEMLTNGQDADDPPGPAVLVGEPVSQLYRVSNTSNVTITEVTVTDLVGAPVNCPGTTLVAGSSMECEAEVIAASGQRRGDAMVTGLPPGGLRTALDVDPSHYFGVAAAIALDALSNGDDADNAPGPMLLVGTALTRGYVVRNVGNVPLSNLSVTDSHIGVVTCPQSSLDPADSMLCVVSGRVEVGQHSSLATVSALYDEIAVTAEDSTHYFGALDCIFDCDGDGDVDLNDFMRFQLMFGGPR